MFPIFETELTRSLRSKKFKLLLVVTLFPIVIYILSPNSAGTGAEALRKGFESLFNDLLPNYWLGIIGQLIAVIIMSDLIASEIDKGTIRLILAKPVKLEEFLAGKFLAGLSTLTLLFGVPYLVAWLYTPLPYHAGLHGLRVVVGDFGAVLGVTVLTLSFVGSLSVVMAVTVRRPLYATLATFGVLFLGQFLIPQIPYLSHPERFSIGYQALVMLKTSFSNVNVIGTPWKTAVAFAGASVTLLFLAWIALTRKEFPD